MAEMTIVRLNMPGQIDGMRPFQQNLSLYPWPKMVRPREVFILATEDAERRWKCELSEVFLKEGLPEPVLKKYGLEETRKSCGPFSKHALIAYDWGYVEAECILDTTTGLRIQPIIAAAAAAFAQVSHRPSNRVTMVYGAFDLPDKPNNISPIFDVTPFLDIVDWAQAIMMFLRTGRGADLVGLTERAAQDARPGIPSDGVTSGLAGLTEPLEAFATDLATIRTGSLLLGTDGSDSTAKGLRDAIDRIETGGVPQAALASILLRLRAMADELCLPPGVSTLAGADAHAVTVNLARRYLEMERYTEAATTATEGLASLVGTPNAGKPGPDFGSKAREKAQKRVRAYCKTVGLEDSDIRNDLNHGGFRKDPADGQTIAAKVTRYVEAFAAATPETISSAGESAHPTPDPTSALFLNISNHRLADWEPAQTEAAQALAPNLAELGFPNVPPDADEAHICALVDELETRVPRDTTHAMVQGEFTLTLALVRRLQERRITCLAATTDRDVETEADGSRRYRFTFRRFRAYCSLA